MIKAIAPYEWVPSRSLEVLVRMIECIAGRDSLLEISKELARQLHELVDFQFLHLSLHDPVHQVMRRVVVEGAADDFQTALPTEVPMDMSLAATVMQSQESRLWEDISEETTCWQVVEYLKQRGMVSYCLLPLTTPQERLGAIGFGHRDAGVYQRDDLKFLEKIVAVVAIAVESVLQHEKATTYEKQLKQDRDHWRTLLEITTQVVSQLDVSDLFKAVSGALRQIMHHDFACLNLLESSDPTRVRVHGLDFPEGRGVIQKEMLVPLEGTVTQKALVAGEVIICRSFEELGLEPSAAKRLEAENLKSICAMPLINRGRQLGCLVLGSFEEGRFPPSEHDFLQQIGNQVAIAVDNAVAFEQLQQLKDKLAEEKLYLEDQIDTEYNFGDIIGESRALKEILKTVETVAPTDATVLIQGETGTGKELLARAIHNLSKRSERTFVKLNCAAIPTGLLESELFGHEKGAFTGAISQKIGRLELADKGTLFLDEVGDIPLEIQPKLLRVLQEQEFERLGSTRTIRVDVRLIAATNRNLAKMVETREFRQDLYYRLRVVPISVPPLRDRRDDIDRLVRYFTQKYARRMGKHFKSIPDATMKALVQWNWPGNIRELENVIERAVILSQGPVLQVPLEEFRESSSEVSQYDHTLDTMQREHILKVLRDTGGLIGGPQGAAARLGMKRSTLQARMKKLGISRNDI